MMNGDDVLSLKDAVSELVGEAFKPGVGAPEDFWVSRATLGRLIEARDAEEASATALQDAERQGTRFMRALDAIAHGARNPSLVARNTLAVIGAMRPDGFDYDPSDETQRTALVASAECVEEFAQVLVSIEWKGVEDYVGDGGYDCCPSCRGVAPESQMRTDARIDVEKGRTVNGHKPDCALESALQKAGLRNRERHEVRESEEGGRGGVAPDEQGMIRDPRKPPESELAEEVFRLKTELATRDQRIAEMKRLLQKLPACAPACAHARTDSFEHLDSWIAWCEDCGAIQEGPQRAWRRAARSDQ